MYITNERLAKIMLSDVQLSTYYEYIEKYHGNVIVDYDIDSHILSFYPLSVICIGGKKFDV